MESQRNKLRASIGNLKKAKQIIAVTCGSKKVDAIAGALRTGLVDVLITDEYTARELLTKYKPSLRAVTDPMGDGRMRILSADG